MLDLENVKTILQAEVNKLEKAKAKWKKYRSSDNKVLEECYERRYNMYRFRFDGMSDMLYDLGYLVRINDENKVCVEKRLTSDDIPIVDVPF